MWHKIFLTAAQSVRGLHCMTLECGLMFFPSLVIVEHAPCSTAAPVTLPHNVIVAGSGFSLVCTLRFLVTSYYLKSKPYQEHVILFQNLLVDKRYSHGPFVSVCWVFWMFPDQGAAKAMWRWANLKPKPGAHLVIILTIFKLRSFRLFLLLCMAHLRSLPVRFKVNYTVLSLMIFQFFYNYSFFNLHWHTFLLKPQIGWSHTESHTSHLWNQSASSPCEVGFRLGNSL